MAFLNKIKNYVNNRLISLMEYRAVEQNLNVFDMLPFPEHDRHRDERGAFHVIKTFCGAHHQVPWRLVAAGGVVLMALAVVKKCNAQPQYFDEDPYLTHQAICYNDVSLCRSLYYTGGRQPALQCISEILDRDCEEEAIAWLSKHKRVHEGRLGQLDDMEAVVVETGNGMVH